MSIDSDREEILELTQQLLIAVTSGDWEKYTQLCDPSITAFEPEALGNLVDGLDFHRFYFQLPGSDTPTPVQSTIVAPHIRVMGDSAVIAYIRLTQRINAAARPFPRQWKRLASGKKLEDIGSTFISIVLRRKGSHQTPDHYRPITITTALS